jgi:hypothetical protein
MNLWKYADEGPAVTRGSQDVEKAVSRTLREMLNTLQRTAEDLNQALNDLVAACGSTRSTNALPPILRAHTAAASLAASLDVLSRFVASSASNPAVAGLSEEDEASATPAGASSRQEIPAAPAKRGRKVAPPVSTAPDVDDVGTVADMGEEPSPLQEPAVEDLATAEVEPQIDSPSARTFGRGRASDLSEEHSASFREFSQEISAGPAGQAINPIEELPAASASFDISMLQPEEQDLHRRANRVAKVSMQDIKMLRPNEVRLGREHKDICLRLRDDIEKAHKEYDRRFQSILVHPVDYFYDWMVQILGEGDPAALGEYPYPSPVPRR